MTPTALIEASTSFLVHVADPAARALALGGAVGLALVALRLRSTSTRLFAWTAVLYAALAMPVLGWMLPVVPVSIPALRFLLPAPHVVRTSQHVTADNPVFIPRNEVVESGGTARLSLESAPVQLGAATQPANSSVPRDIPWIALAAAAYLAIAAAFLLRLFVGLAFGRRLMCSAEDLEDPRVAATLARHAYAAGLRTLPRVAESDAISVPVTMGVWRPTILLPADWREWDPAKLGAVIAHEVSHVARRDALTQRLALLYRAVFWFSPLAWWLDRSLAELAEEASDEAALSGGADRADYARTLLGFFEALQAAPGRVWWQGVAMAKAGQAERRVDRILAWKGAVSMGVKKSIAVMIVALAVPVVYLAASVRPNNPNLMQQEATPPPAPAPVPHAAPAPKPSATPAPAVVPVPVPEPSPDGTPAPQATPAPASVPPPAAAVAPVASITPGLPPVPGTEPVGGVVAPMSLVTPYAIREAQSAQSGRTTSSSGNSYAYYYGNDSDQPYVIVSGKTDSVTMSGSSEDLAHAKALKSKIPGDFIWFRRDEKSYVIRDQSTVDRARKLWEPQEELGKQQDELGKQQEALGEQQEQLGKKMEEVRVKVPDLSAEMDKLKAELKKLSEGGTQEELGDIQSEIGELQSKIGELQSNAGEAQGKLGEEMSKLGEQQGKLGEQQGKLGELQGKLAEHASRQMKQLLDDALAHGLAQPEP